MPESDTSTGADGTERIAEPAVSEAVQSTECYEIEDGVVFYDAKNPLAWVQADRTVDLDEAA